MNMRSTCIARLCMSQLHTGGRSTGAVKTGVKASGAHKRISQQTCQSVQLEEVTAARQHMLCGTRRTGVAGNAEGTADAGAAAGDCTARKRPRPSVLLWLPASAQAAHAATSHFCEPTSSSCHVPLRLQHVCLQAELSRRRAQCVSLQPHRAAHSGVGQQGTGLQRQASGTPGEAEEYVANW